MQVFAHLWRLGHSSKITMNCNEGPGDPLSPGCKMTPQIRLETDMERSGMNRGYTLFWRKIWANPLLVERGKVFSRLEAWLYLTNILAAGMDDEEAGLKRGEFGASSRYLAQKWNWPRSTVQRFFMELESVAMICRIEGPRRAGNRVNPSLGHLAGHFAVQNKRSSKRNKKRSKKRSRKERHTRAVCRRRPRVSQNPFRNLSATKPIAARGEGTYFRKAEEVPVKD